MPIKYNAMKIYGLTGGIGCGKSTISRILQTLGFQIIDADALTHELHKNPDICRTLADIFGPEILMSSPTGLCINRKNLGKLVFNTPDARTKLDEIMRPALRSMVIERLSHRTAPTILDAALLFEAGWHNLTDENIVVLCPEHIRSMRIQARDGLSEQQALSRIRAQMSDAERIARADCLIYNTGDIQQLKRQIHNIFDITKPSPITLKV